MRRLLATLLLSSALASPAGATILTLADIGASGTGTFNGAVDGTTVIPQLHASLTLTLVSVTAATNTWNFAYSYTNTTSAPFTASTGAFGFNTTPDLDGFGVTSGFFTGAETNANISSGIKGLDFCTFVGSTCSGNSSLGLNPGQTGTGTFFLSFAGTATAATTITLTDYVNRYQEITGPGQNGSSGTGQGTDVVITPVAAVPGPLLGSGIPGLIAACFALLALNKKRKQRLGIA